MLTTGAGSYGTSVAAPPTAPVLSWITPNTDNTPDFSIVIDDTVGTNDNLQFQTATAGTSFASPTTTNHTITSGEDTANSITLGLSSLTNGNYEARCRLSKAATPTNWSAWSNVVSFDIAVSAGPVAITCTDHKIDPSDSNTYSFAAVAFGATGGRTVIGVAVRIAGSVGAVSAANINGSITLTQLGQFLGAGGAHRIVFLGASGLAITSGTVNITLDGAGATRCGLGAWRVANAASLTPSDVQSSDGSAGATVTVPANGGAIGMSIGLGDGAHSSDYTWVGLSTEDFDEVVEGTVMHSGAHQNFTTGGATAMNDTSTSGTTTTTTTLFAAWGP
jgi:hypothetical protein